MMKRKLIVVSLSEVFKTVELVNHAGTIEVLKMIVQKLPNTGVSGEWLQEMLKTNGLEKQKVICLLPNDLVNFKSLTLPLLPAEQLSGALQLEIENTYGESYVKILTQQPQAEMNQLKVAIVKRESYFAHCELWRQAGLEIEWAGFAFRGIQNFINFHKDFLENQTQSQIYLEGNSNQISFGVINGESLLFKREFTPGTAELEQAQPDLVDDLVGEVRLSIAAYNKVVGEQALSTKILGFGSWSNVELLKKKLQKELNLSLEFPKQCRLTGKIEPEKVSEVADLIGLGLEELGWNSAESLRLYSPAREKQLNYMKLLQAASAWVVAGCLIVTGILFWLNATMIREKKDITWLAGQEETLLKLSHAENQTRQKMARLKALQEWQVDNLPELEFLTVLEQALPEDTIISNLTLEAGVVKDLSGTTPSVSYLLNQLKKVPLLQNLKLKGTITVTPEGELFHLEGLIREKVKK